MGSYLSRKQIEQQECCGSTDISTPPNSRPPSPSQRSESPPLPIVIYCGNVNCGLIATAEEVQTWKEARIGTKKIFYFCTDDCWKEWLSLPSYLGSWSSPLSFATVTTDTLPKNNIPMLTI
jgi:hypothetical protein